MTNVPSPTARLILRPATIEDAPFFLELLTSKGWLDNIGDRGVYTLEEARNYFTKRIQGSYEVPGCGPMLCVLKSDGTIIGNTGVYDRPGLDLPDYGFAFLDKYQRQGYAHEASVSNLAFAEAHGHTELLAITLPTNQPSIRLLEKLGFVSEEELIRIPDDEEDLMLLRWRSERSLSAK